MDDNRPNAEKVLNTVRAMPDPSAAVSNVHDAIKQMKQCDNADAWLIKCGYRLAARSTVVFNHAVFQYSTWIDESETPHD